MCTDALFVCMSVHHTHAYSAHKRPEGVKDSGTRVVDACELPYGSWQLNLGSLEEPPGLLHSWALFPIPTTIFVLIYFSHFKKMIIMIGKLKKNIWIWWRTKEKYRESWKL